MARRSSLPAVVRSTTWLLKDTLAGGAPTTTVPLRHQAAGAADAVTGTATAASTAGTFEAGTFKLHNANAAGAPTSRFTFGDPRGYPVAGDFDGDGGRRRRRLSQRHLAGPPQRRQRSRPPSTTARAAGRRPSPSAATGTATAPTASAPTPHDSATWNLRTHRQHRRRRRRQLHLRHPEQQLPGGRRLGRRRRSTPSASRPGRRGRCATPTPPARARRQPVQLRRSPPTSRSAGNCPDRRPSTSRRRAAEDAYERPEQEESRSRRRRVPAG